MVQQTHRAREGEREKERESSLPKWAASSFSVYIPLFSYLRLSHSDLLMCTVLSDDCQANRNCCCIFSVLHHTYICVSVRPTFTFCLAQPSSSAKRTTNKAISQSRDSQLISFECSASLFGRKQFPLVCVTMQTTRKHNAPPDGKALPESQLYGIPQSSWIGNEGKTRRGHLYYVNYREVA